MTPVEIVTGITIHLLVPLIGVALFVSLCLYMRRVGIPSPPTATFFMLFFAGGGWLLVALTALFWEWSGMASLGVFFLVLAMPWVTAVAAWRLHSKRSLSSVHRVAFVGSLGYSGLMLGLMLAWTGMFLTRPH